MKDSEIVDLYWDRNEDAIHQTQLKYEAYLSKVAYSAMFDIPVPRKDIKAIVICDAIYELNNAD